MEPGNEPLESALERARKGVVMTQEKQQVFSFFLSGLLSSLLILLFRLQSRLPKGFC